MNNREFEEKYNLRSVGARCCFNCKHGETEWDGEESCFHPDRPRRGNGRRERLNTLPYNVCDAWEKKKEEKECCLD